MTYVPIKFPGWRYGPDGQSAIFECSADVPKGWTDNPNDYLDAEGNPIPLKPVGDPIPGEVSREEMCDALTARQIKFDKRWSDSRLRALLA